jgi:hypothetical protein
MFCRQLTKHFIDVHNWVPKATTPVLLSPEITQAAGVGPSTFTSPDLNDVKIPEQRAYLGMIYLAY